ncbi:MAG TPA: small ribosomal subunit Rsm22 family protein [Stellaceae bacterium]|nr:small ribosomal subunit Rsm22 family protein [Stellaceae bacterium]
MVDLPDRLSRAIDVLVQRAAPMDLPKVVAGLSARYRSGKAGGAVADAKDVAAYVSARMPATFAAVAAALDAVAVARPGFMPASHLDAGSGPGTAMWAAAHIWPEAPAWQVPGHILLLDDSAVFQESGRFLAGHAASPGLREATWRRADLSLPLSDLGSHELVTAAYLLGELTGPAQIELLAQLWAACSGMLVLVEPGTPQGFARILAARSRLIGLGGHVIAPCPHDRDCPLEAPDWCHFATRVQRTQLHRRAKSAVLGYEDEKYAYVALVRPRPLQAARSPAEAVPAGVAVGRVLRSPRLASGHVELSLCTDETASRHIVSRRAGAGYRLARKARWGDWVDMTNAETPVSRPGAGER